MLNTHRLDIGPTCVSTRVKALLAIFALSICVSAQPAKAVGESDKSWEQLQRTGTDALDTNRYWIAEPSLQQALLKAEHFGPKDMRFAKTLGELGRLYTIRGRFEEAEAFLEEELSVIEQAQGTADGQSIPAIGSLVQFYLKHGTQRKADPLTDDVLKFVGGRLEDPQPRNPGKVILKKGQELEAFAGTADAEMRDPMVDWAITCDAMANAYRAAGKYDYADRLFKAALDLKFTVYGKNHLTLANSYDSLGELCLERNEVADAESYFRDALTTTERTVPGSPQIFPRLDKLAKCKIKLGKFDEAEQLYLRAQTFWKGQPTKTNEEARAIFALGSLYVDEKKYEEAAPVLERALRIAEQVNGPAALGLVPYLQRYAYALYYLGRKPEVSQLRERADTIAGVGLIQ